jgi:serine/threonine protein kinase
MTLKITDFGFAKKKDQLAGGLTRTNLGSKPYKAPEIILNKAYEPPCTDLFAAGAILFILMVGFPAFSEAKEDNSWYKMIWDQDFPKFWQSVEKYRPEGSIALSLEFKSLIQGLICREPK